MSLPNLLRKILMTGGVIAGSAIPLTAPLIAHATSMLPMTGGTGASAYCGTVLVRHGRPRRFADYCQVVEQELAQNGPFAAALIKAHRIDASLYFTALANGKVVAAVFLRGSGNRQIDLGLMHALASAHTPVMTGRPETFILPVELRARDQNGFVAYRIQLVPYGRR